MKTLKKALSFVLCALMLASGIINDGWLSVIPSPEASAMAGHEQSYNDARIELDFNKGWSFTLTDDDAAYLKGYDDSSWEKVDLPHDFSISQEFTTDGETEAENGQLPGGTGWYRKWFNLYDYYTGDRVILNFDGAYQHTYVYVNGQYVGENHYGYNSFSFEISDYLICSNTAHNLIAVKVVNELPSSRWYSGSGINRDVTLTIAGPVHVSLYGPRITTPDIADGMGTVKAKIKMHNDTAISKKVTVEATVLDSNHNVVSDTVVSSLETVSANSEKTVELSPVVANPALWSPDSPELYMLKTIIKNEQGELIDEYHTTFGFRYIEWNADKGFILNGVPTKLKGVSLHHDQGALGAVQEYEAIYRQLTILKEMGCNAIRTTHNNASKVFLELCNEMGFLVIEEFFDGWDAAKNGNENDFSKYFSETIDSSNTAIGANGQKWYEYVVESAILRDEHDPCIIAWDIGNELTTGISGADATADYAEILDGILAITDRLDPDRAVLHGSNGPNDSVLKMIDEKMDVIGGNYNPWTWLQDVMTNSSDSRSSKPFVATEAASAINSRGVYYKMTTSTSDSPRQCTSYDTDSVSWGLTAAESWYYVAVNDWFSGEFVWTGFDYIGEPTPWNDGVSDNENSVPNSSYFGIVDTAGFAKDSYYLYRSLWNDKSTTLHLVPGSWNQDNLLLNNGWVNVAVYSNAKRIELLLNGEVIGTAVSTVKTTDAGYTYRTWSESVDSSKCAVGNFYTRDGEFFYSQFSVKYAEGTLSVKAYDENGDEITDTVGSTESVSGNATQIAANVWNNLDTFTADGTDYIYVEYEARDADGNFMNDYNGTLNIKVDDSSARYAKIVGVDNGNAATTEKFQQPSVLLSDSEAEIQMFNGKALVILKTTEEEGTVNITATATENGTSFSAEGVTFTTVSEKGIELTDELGEVITQNNNPYQPTLYDEFEVVKYHVNKLERPADDSSSGSSGNSNAYSIYLPTANGKISDGEYVVTYTPYNPYLVEVYAMTGTSLYGYSVAKQKIETDIVTAPDGSAYAYESFQTDSGNVYVFTGNSSNQYSIMNKSTGKYLNISSDGIATFSDTAQFFTVEIKDNGSVRIVINSLYLGGDSYGGISGISTSFPEQSYTLWLYSVSTQTTPSVSDLYNIYPVDSSASQYIPDGNYVINIGDDILTDVIYDGWAISSASVSSDITFASDTAAYNYESFGTEASYVLKFTHQGNNKYYIQNVTSGLYLYDSLDTVNNTHNLLYGTTPYAFVVLPNSDGSIRIYSDLNNSTFYIHNGDWGCFEFYASISEMSRIWLYSETEQSSSSATETTYIRYQATSGVTTPVADGDYVLCNIQQGYSHLVSGEPTNANNGAVGIANVDVSSIIASDYSSLTTTADSVYTFTSLENGKYYIQHKSSQKYLSINSNNSVTLVNSQTELNIATKTNGDILIYNDNSVFLDLFWDHGKVFSAWYSTLVNAHNNNNEAFTLYSAQTSEDTGNSGENTGNSATGSAAKLALYEALYDGIEVDYSIYTRESFENLLRYLENGVGVFTAESSTDADYEAAKDAIYAAIEALEMDIKKIDGTLFKYGYSNLNGTPDYSDGGTRMNAIAVRQMKEAILSDANLVRQIKDIIGYDNEDMNWLENQADEVLDEVAEIYARIYTLHFTGDAYNGSDSRNGASNSEQPAYHSNPTVSLWNLWTKANTHGANDPIIDGTPLHDGASVQGLASATLEKGVITSHSAYSEPLSYGNDGPKDADDITNYIYGFSTQNNAYHEVTLEYLSGISVYFPDLFTRENLDVDGNVTASTEGTYSKYYWDTGFPMFISTDEYGVNTYHFDSKDTTYLVQTEFFDDENRAEMELNEVGSWNASGSHSGSGFFPFNYKMGTTTYTGENAIYHYGFTFEHSFYIPKGGKHANGEDVIFNFSGDDDVYVYIDGVLVLDNGGLHGAREATINFTNCTVNYQYVMDVADGVLKGDEYEITYSYNELIENPDTVDYNADTIAALNKLHEVISDGEVHTLNFFYLERGASDSNCRMSFNLSETSEEVRIIDQNLTLDYGLSVEYNIQDNNNISQAAIDNGVEVEYLGICAVNEEVTSTYTFELPEIIVPFEEGVTYNVEGMKYGNCTIDKQGNVTYDLKSMDMSESEHFYVCARITGDPTYAESVVYYQIERTTFVPASTIYYEDTYECITYTDGKVPANYDNTANKYGLWQTDGEQQTTLKQTADLTDSEANPYGFETNYSSFAEYSGGSIHYVDVSTKNNPNKRYSGGEGAKWPTVDFTFTGTGFDLISITDNTTGAFSVTVKNADGTTVRNTVVDTFYGYNYGQIFADANGKPTLDSNLTTMYRSADGTCTSSKRYYDENGKITDVAHYYDGDTVVDYVTENPAFAYAYGWVVAEEGTTEKLYQIPVIKITDLEYGKYNVTITPTFTSIFGHASVNTDGTKYYRVYFDAIKIYSPAGIGDDITDEYVRDAYATDDELYPDYLELKNMLIGAEALSENEEQGIIFIDGIAALDNDIEKYRDAGPNNELYLAKDQAVAFEIWATSVPTDIQLGAKLACGKPQLTVSYNANTTPVDINTAHDTFYSLNSVLPNNAKLTWRLVEGADGNMYYTTGTVVIQNTGAEDSVLSVTNLKWTFSQSGGKGYFRIPTPLENEVVTLAATEDTPMMAYSLMRMRTAALDVEQIEEPEITVDENGTSLITVKINTSSDVDEVVIFDENGNEITPESIEKTVSDPESGYVGWTVTIAACEPGSYTYTVAGAYENGYVDYSKAITVTVDIKEQPTQEQPGDETENPSEDEEPGETESSVFDTIIGFYNRIIEFFRALLAIFGVTI